MLYYMTTNNIDYDRDMQVDENFEMYRVRRGKKK